MDFQYRKKGIMRFIVTVREAVILAVDLGQFITD